VLVLDLNMPGGSSIEASEHLVSAIRAAAQR
jgi:hypothetical protein